ncbi:MAG: peptidoglycan bridge formation glycyltransferase FemA/FemB family protein [Chloroflexi bacterium]|nr:peptidoglycan bridge formation glycyltransferase FemA/FemB family protein [Chloroflexota bacterium]
MPAQPSDRTAWDAFVAARPEADVLQAWAWGAAMAPAGEPALRLLARDDDGEIRGLAQALVRPTSLGRAVLYVPHGPLWRRDAADAHAVLAGLVRGLREAAVAHRGIVVKVDPARDRVGLDDSGAVVTALEAAGLRPARHDLQARTTLIVDLAGDDGQIAGRWTPEARNLARRSAREGLVVEITRHPDAGALEEAGALLVATGTRRGFRTHDVPFLSRLAAELDVSAGWYLAIGRLDGRPLGVMVVARTGDRAAYLYGGSLRDDANRHANPGYGVMAAMMSALARDGVRWFDLWGVHDERDVEADASWQGFSAFKRRFGGREVRHPGTFDLVVSAAWYRLRDLRERLRDQR